MSVWIQVHRTTQLMDFFIEMASKRSDTAGHDVNDRMLNPMFLYVSLIVITRTSTHFVKTVRSYLHLVAT